MYVMTTRRHNRRGFSIPEMIIGLALLAFTMLGAYALMTSGLSDVSETRDFSAAVLLAQEAVEACRGHRFEAIDEDDPAMDAAGNPLGGTNGEKSLEYDFNNDGGAVDHFPHQLNQGGIQFTRTVVIDNVDRVIPSGLPAGIDAPPIRLKAVKVTVAWRNTKGRDLTYVVDTLLSPLYR